MDTEFHYYVVNIIAQRAGFNNEDSYVLAYSSQYVDDNTVSLLINKGEEGEYKNYISQTMNILKPMEKLMRVYPCFHFVPGDPDCDQAMRKDGKLHIMNTTPNGPNAQAMFDEAMGTRSLYRIGICVHSYADTWAHQNFVGYMEYFNGMGKASHKLLDKLLPNIGHADARHKPDIPGLIWKDFRLIKEHRSVSNKTRFLEAAEYIFKKLRSYLKPRERKATTEKDWQELKIDLDQAIGDEFEGKDPRKKKRIAAYKNLINEFKEYDEKVWFKEAVETDVRGGADTKDGINIFPDKYYKRSNFLNSHWYAFQESIKAHQKWAVDLYANLYHQLEVNEY